MAATIATAHLAVDLASPRQDEVETPRVVQTLNPKLGIHTRLTDEGSTDRITRTYRLVRQMGAAWVTEYLPWPYVQGNHPDELDWRHADRLVERAVMEGLRVILRIDSVPAWARPPGTTFKHLDPDRYDAFASFAAAVAARYRGRVSHLIIWNEPNLSYEWGQRAVDPIAYTRLLDATYPAVKKANPAIVVVAAGLAPTTEPAGSPWGLDDLEYLRAMYRAGAARSFDALAIHAYGLKASPDEPPSPGRLNFARAQLTRGVMEEFGDGHKPGLITEGGWNDSPRWTHGVPPAQRIAYTLRAYQLAQEWPWLEAMCLWTFRTPRPTRTYHDHFAFVAPDFTLTPLYREVQRVARGREPPADEP